MGPFLPMMRRRLGKRNNDVLGSGFSMESFDIIIDRLDRRKLGATAGRLFAFLAAVNLAGTRRVPPKLTAVKIGI
jgi:hypothetical protein